MPEVWLQMVDIFSKRKRSKKFTLVEMFVGAGGSHLGFKKQGDFDTVLVSDIEEDMCQTFKHNNPEVPHVIKDDIHNMSGKRILELTGLRKGELDVIFGGIVCKGFSLAGVRSSLDPRNDLYKKYIRLVRELQPRVAIIENVPGMASMMIRKGGEFSEDKKRKINEAWTNLKKLNGLKASIRKGQASARQRSEAREIEKNKAYYRKRL